MMMNFSDTPVVGMRASRRIAFAVRWCVPVFCVIAGTFVFLNYRYGSVRAAVLVWSGTPIELQEQVIELDYAMTPEARRITFTLANHSTEKVRIVGSFSECSCTGAIGLPVTIEPHGIQTIEAIVTPSGDQPIEIVPIVLLSDVASQPHIVGYVRSVTVEKQRSNPVDRG